MSNRNELKKARRAVEVATATLAAIEALPRRVGQMVRWGHSGVIWRRVGDDAWAPLHRSDNYEPNPDYGTYPSAHVATVSRQGWTPIKELLADGEELNL